MSDKEEETRGRKRKELETTVLLDIIESHDEVLTTQEIRRKFNSREHRGVAHRTVWKNLDRIDCLQNIKVSDRTGWLKKGD